MKKDSPKEPQNCWEFWDCPKDIRENCPAYKLDSGKECWMFAGSFRPDDLRCPKNKHNIKHCWECPWFKKIKPDFDKKKEP